MVKIDKHIYYYLDFDSTKTHFPHLLVVRIRFKHLKNVATLLSMLNNFFQNIYKDKTIEFKYIKE